MSADPRYSQLARLLTDFSTRLAPGENVLIDVFDIPEPMTVALVRAARARGAVPFVQVNQNRVLREMLSHADEGQYTTLAELELARMQRMQAYIALRGSHNITELSDVPPERMQLAMRALRPVLDHRIQRTKWCVLRWPTTAMAQLAGMSTEAFEDFYFDVCTLDYSRMEPGMAALKERLERTDAVHITGPGTDLRFSIKGIPAICCGGSHNIPDGEVFSCPVKDSVQGKVTFNAPTIYQGTNFDGLVLEFVNGRIVRAAGNPQAKLEAILDSDEGARYIGEFSLAFNPHILQPMRDILFDEKIAGSFHFTPGQAYEGADNGNRSQVHWDMVNIQRPDYGGGEIRFDGELIRRDGLFVPEALRQLNPDALLAGSSQSPRLMTMNDDADYFASPTFPVPDFHPAPDFGNVNEEPPTSPAAIAAAAAELIAAATAVAAAVSPLPSSLSVGQSPSLEDPGLAAGAISPSDLRARPANVLDLPPMNPLERRLNYKFRNPLLLAEALTHPSLAHETQRPYFDNQRLEYLGDAVIQVVFSEHLFRLYPEAGEGFLTKMRARLVSGEALRSYALNIRLGQYLMMGRGDENSGGRQRGSTLADAYEALAGAMFIDSGGDLATSRRFLLVQAKDRLMALDEQPLEINPKGQLQEILQALPYPDPDLPSSAPRNPTYAILLEAGPDHAKRFAAHVVWAGHVLGRGDGASKQQAETAAALDALRHRAWNSLPITRSVDGAVADA